MRKLFKHIYSQILLYHLLLWNSPLQKMVRSSNQCLDEYNNDKATRRILLFWLILLLAFVITILKR